MRSRHRAHGQDDGDKRGAGGDRVLEQLEASVTRTQPLRRDPRPDHGDEEEGGADELCSRPPGQQHAAVVPASLVAQAPAPQLPSARSELPGATSESAKTVYTSHGAPSGSLTQTLSCRA